MQKCLETEIKAHESLHDQMEELAFMDEAVLQAEHVERDKHDAIHTEVFAELGDLLTRLDLWGVGMDLNNDLEALRALKEPGKPHFIKTYEEFRKGVKDLGHQCHVWWRPALNILHTQLTYFSNMNTGIIHSYLFGLIRQIPN